MRRSACFSKSSIRTFARREGDRYVISGQKIWTSRAEHSDLMLLLARTTPKADAAKRTDGMSVFILDMREAILQDRHVVLTVYAVFGRVRLIVPSGVEVIMNGTDILGRQRGGTARRVPTSSEVPVIEVRGYLAASEVLARTPPRPRRWLPGWRKSIS